MKPTHRRAMLVVVGVAAVQGLALWLYVAVERSRKPPAPVFPVAQLRGGIAPDLALSGADGAIRRLEELRGTPVLLHFWATWCPPCRQEMPALLQLARDLRREEGLEVVAASVDASWQSIDLFFDGKTPAQVYRVDGDALRSFGVEELPDSYIVGRDGLLRARIEGARDWSSPAAREAVRAALARHESDGNTE